MKCAIIVKKLSISLSYKIGRLRKQSRRYENYWIFKGGKKMNDNSEFEMGVDSDP